MTHEDSSAGLLRASTSAEDTAADTDGIGAKPETH